MTGETGGLRKRRLNTFVQVPSKTIRDRELSFRARGILAYLLDMPDGWDVKSEVIASQGKEGREAVRTSLGELATRGYYRLERRQLLNGTFVMGTAISEESVPDWVTDSAEYNGRAVPMVQQPDHTFRVRHKDGRLTKDGFEDVPLDSSPDGPDDNPPGGSNTGDGFSGPGFPGAGQPGPGTPDSGPPDSGQLGALSKTETSDRDTESTSDAGSADAADASSPKPARPELTPLEVETGRDAQGKALRGEKRKALAHQITTAWWEWTASEGHAHPASGFLAARAVVDRALGAEVNPKVIRHALARLTNEGHAVSGNTLQIAVREVTNPGRGAPGVRRAYRDADYWPKAGPTSEADPPPPTPEELAAEFGIDVAQAVKILADRNAG